MEKINVTAFRNEIEAMHQREQEMKTQLYNCIVERVKECGGLLKLSVKPAGVIWNEVVEFKYAIGGKMYYKTDNKYTGGEFKLFNRNQVPAKCMVNLYEAVEKSVC